MQIESKKFTNYRKSSKKNHKKLNLNEAWKFLDDEECSGIESFFQNAVKINTSQRRRKWFVKLS